MYAVVTGDTPIQLGGPAPEPVLDVSDHVSELHTNGFWPVRLIVVACNEERSVIDELPTHLLLGPRGRSVAAWLDGDDEAVTIVAPGVPVHLTPAQAHNVKMTASKLGLSAQELMCLAVLGHLPGVEGQAADDDTPPVRCRLTMFNSPLEHVGYHPSGEHAAVVAWDVLEDGAIDVDVHAVAPGDKESAVTALFAAGLRLAGVEDDAGDVDAAFRSIVENETGQP